MANYHRRTNCRLCDSTALKLAIPMKPSPIGDAFVKDKNSEQELFPLDVYICETCAHLQNLDVVDPKILFGNYTYQTSHSLGLVEHFKKYAAHVVSKLGIDKPVFVMEIGSNDGSLLGEFQALGHTVQGIDASSAVAGHANKRGVPTIGDFFTFDLSQKIKADKGQAGLVCANNVYAHADNLRDITKGIRNVLSDDGVFVFEVSYLPDMVENMVFDTIYHEHVSYHTLNPLEKFFNSLDLSLFDVERVPTKGGSIRAFAQPKSTGKRPRTAALDKLMADEIAQHYDQIETYHRYAQKIVDCKNSTLALIRKLSADMSKVAGYGASTTTTTLLYNYELEGVLDRIYDDNAIKYGTFSPGAHIEVSPSEEILSRKPKAIVILAWVYAKPIIKRNRNYVEAGGTFVIPLPVPMTVDASNLDHFLNA
jgi:SAM-dependent methyltransferase